MRPTTPIHPMNQVKWNLAHPALEKTLTSSLAALSLPKEPSLKETSPAGSPLQFLKSRAYFALLLSLDFPSVFFFPSDLIWESFLALFGILFHSLLFFFAHRDELIYLQLKIYENVVTSPAIRMFGTWFYDIFEIRQKLLYPDLCLDLNKSFYLSI